MDKYYIEEIRSTENEYALEDDTDKYNRYDRQPVDEEKSGIVDQKQRKENNAEKPRKLAKLKRAKRMTIGEGMEERPNSRHRNKLILRSSDLIKLLKSDYSFVELRPSPSDEATNHQHTEITRLGEDGDGKERVVKESFIGVVDNDESELKRTNLTATGDLGLGKLAETQLGSRPPQHQQQPSYGKTRLGKLFNC